MTPSQRHDAVSGLLPGQFDALVTKLGVPVQILSGANAPLATRTSELLQWAVQQDRLGDVDRFYEDVSRPVWKKPAARLALAVFGVPAVLGGIGWGIVRAKPSHAVLIVMDPLTYKGVALGESRHEVAAPLPGDLHGVANCHPAPESGAAPLTFCVDVEAYGTVALPRNGLLLGSDPEVLERVLASAKPQGPNEANPLRIHGARFSSSTVTVKVMTIFRGSSPPEYRSCDGTADCLPLGKEGTKCIVHDTACFLRPSP